MKALLLLAAMLFASPSEPSETPALGPGFSAELKAGFPWLGGSIRQTLHRNMSLTVESETALGRRWESRAGIHRRWELGSSWLMTLGTGLGWVVQKPSVPRQGVQTFGRLQLRRNTWLAPWLAVDFRHLIALSRLAIQSSQGNRVDWRTKPYTSTLVQLGLTAAIQGSWAVDGQLVFGEVDDVFSIPGASLGLRWTAP